MNGVQSHVETAMEIALGLFNEGRYEDARLVLSSAKPESGDDLLAIKIRLAVIEQWDEQLDEAEKILDEIMPLAESSSNLLLKGRYHYNRHYFLRRTDRRDDAIIALTAASYYYGKAGERELCADAENNLGNLLVDARKFEDAHRHFDNAMRGCKDLFKLAQISDSRALAYLTEGKPRKALPFARKAVELVEDTDRQPLFVKHVQTLNLVCDALEKQFKIDEERPKIRAALIEAKGEPTAAARILNMKRGTLDFKLENQFKELLPLRAEKKKSRGIHTTRKTEK